MVWTPCAGPILASVIALAATTPITWQIVAITLAYAIGSALPMLLLMLGGGAVINSSRFLSRYTEKIRQVFGVIMVATAVALYFHVEEGLQQLTLNYLPAISVENSAVVTKELEKLRATSSSPLLMTSSKKMPDFIGISKWINSPPLTPEILKGKVVLVDFWTYSCINCIRTLPYLKEWDKKYRDQGLVIVGVHTPEFEFEKDVHNVEEAVKRFEMHYAVALDNDYGTWSAYHNSYWPAHYLFDQQGILRQTHLGEGAYVETENEIRKLLGLTPLAEKESEVRHRMLTPETYLGYRRAEHYASGLHLVLNEMGNYLAPAKLTNDTVGLSGLWKVEGESVISGSSMSELSLNFLAPRVYLVMSSEKEVAVQVLLDGQPLPKKYVTQDMDDQGRIRVQEARKYDVVNLHMEYGRHILTLVVPTGAHLFAFTFGDEP